MSGDDIAKAFVHVLSLPPHVQVSNANKIWCNKNVSITPLRRNNYRKTSNISRTLVGDKIVDNSNVVGASPVGAAPTTSSFST